ncbi:MAG: hypothetical protein JWO80_6439 [Bryobacterales bacterium]|nr:hypothetical protein [Bryobacterales bacterium]
MLLFVCSGLAVCASLPHYSRPVILPVVDANDIRFIHVSFGKGPSQSRVSHIVQDHQGFLWFGTQDGLKRYDGYELRSFPYDPRDPNGPSGVFTRSLIADRSGRLWVGYDLASEPASVSHGFLDRYDPATEIFKHYRRDDGPFAGPMSDINQDRDGVLWFTTDQGLIRMDSVTGWTIRYEHRLDDPAGLSSNLVRSTFEEKNGTFWVATTKGLDLFDRRSAKVVQRIPLPEGFPLFEPNPALQVSLCEDHSGVLWMIFSHGYGLARVDRQVGALTFYSLDGTGTDNTLQSGARAIHEDQDGTLWIGTTAGGVLKLDRDRRRFVRYRKNPSDPESLSGDQVNALFEDREGNIWVGTTGAGVNRFARRPPLFKRYRHEIGNPNSLDMDYTTSVYEDSRGMVWVGSMRALGRMDRKTGRMTFYRAAGGPGELSSAWIISIVEDRSGYLWFGTVGAGLNRLDPRTGKFKVHRHDPADPHSLSHNTVTKLFVDGKDTLWAGTEDGLDAFDPATENFQRYKPSGQSENRVRDIGEDSKGALWIATLGTGLLRLDPVTRQFTTYRHTRQPESLSNDQASAICVDHSGIVWIGTESGLNRFDPATRSFTGYYESDGLPSSNISRILEDERGDLWVSTNNGLSRFNVREKTFKNYYVSDGIAGNEFYNYASAYKSPSGEMFFNSYAGLTTFFPRDVIDDRYVPPVVITDFKISGNSVPIGGKSPLQRSISFSDTVTLSDKQNILSLEFSALSYTSPEGNRYRYRLEGLETRWNESEGNRRFITYALSPGEYLFRVQGSNSHGIWNQKGATVRVVILPPFWSTWWFRTLAAAAILLSLGYAYYSRLQNIERQFDMRLDERVGERTRIARELHDTLLQNFQGLMLRLQAVRNLLTVRPADAGNILEGAIDQAAQAITESRDAIQDLRSFPVIGSDLAQAVTALGEELAADSAIDHPGRKPATFRMLVEGMPKDLHPIPRDDIYRIAREALRNAFAHAEARRIEVEIRYGERQLRLRVRDDGKGIDPKLLGERGRAGHWGLPGMRERAKLTGGHLDVWSELGAGAEVELSIPAPIAYATSPGRRRSRLFAKWRQTSS